MTGTYIAHHGIKGQKWGVRNYQNPDGSYTAAGRARYGIGAKKENSDKPKKSFGDKATKALGATITALSIASMGATVLSSIKISKKTDSMSDKSNTYQYKNEPVSHKTYSKYTNSDYYNSWHNNVIMGQKEKKGLSDKAKKALKIGAAVTATALVAYGAYRLSKNPRVAEEFAKAKSSISKAVSEAKDKTKQDLSGSMNGVKNKDTKRLLPPGGFHDDYNRAHDPKPVYKMSNQELKKVVERRNLEKQYNQQLEPDKKESLYKQGKKVISEVISDAGMGLTVMSMYNQYKRAIDNSVKESKKKKKKNDDNKE